MSRVKPHDFSVGKVVFGVGVEDFILFLSEHNITKDCTTVMRRVQLEADVKIGEMVLPAGITLIARPRALRDLERDGVIATFRLGGEAVTVYIRQGFVRSPVKKEPGRAVSGRSPRYASRMSD